MYDPELNMILTRFARKLTGQHDVDDLVQQTFLKMLINKDKFDGTNIKPWACTILHNEFINQCRAKKKHTDEPVETAVKLESQFNPESELNVSYIEKQIDNLPVRLKDVFKDRISGLSYSELVEKYKKPMGTIKAYIFESRQKLMKTA